MAIIMDGPAGKTRKRKSKSELKSEQISNGHSTALLKVNAVPTEHGKEMDKKLDQHETFEFGGPVGVTAMMLLFPVLMYYLWICLWYYNGKFVHPTSFDDIRPFFQRMGQHIYEGAYPTKFAWATYLGLTVIQLFLAAIMPGVMQNGLPVPSLNYAVLPYLCNACWSWYTTLILAYVFHTTGFFRLPWIVENFGHLMTVAILTSYICSGLMDIFARTLHWGGKPLRMSGVWVYDHFMGVSLNPRLGPVDLKMFAEVRVPWVLLFLIALSGTVKQYEELGRVTPNMLLFLTGSGLYINACAKAEHMIPQTWDMFHEKFGWMLIFWNMAGVPFTYCYPVIALVRAPSMESYELSRPLAVICFITLFTAYYIFDSCMAQKSNFKMQQQGDYHRRYAFPVVPWSVVENPTYIQTAHGNKLLTSGWWAYARKINYTADWVQSCMWAISGGFMTPITWFYPVFFLAVLTHRCQRDFEKCARKYGVDWEKYCQVVKWKFIPGVY
ncbi:delta24(24(1))-sterol reductase [Tremella mesenterica]|uniref:Delta(24(24(1)))-sterol reductase n=1 Tax=Tremella mesenterica TaxID=5217 RepID=A0A4Q1BTI4_TREME|nr:delta24(24(1))-sterol reductase [Tremella mesenterica]